VGHCIVRYIAVQQILAVLYCGPLYLSIQSATAEPSSRVVAVGHCKIRYIAVEQILGVLCFGPLYRSVHSGTAVDSSAVLWLWAILPFGTKR
jgi:hypothetical protein